MALELIELATEAGLGVISGLADPAPTGGFGLPPLVLGTTNISWGTVAEAAGIVIGAGMQLMMPFTLPEVAEGLTSAGVALLGHRLAHEFTKKPSGISGGVGTVGTGAIPFPYSPQIQPSYANPAVAPWAGAAARPSVGSMPGLNKLVLR